jgi:phytoene dehydrogenase-like protein
MALLSPFFRAHPLDKYGVQWVRSSAPLAHVFEGDAVLLENSVDETAAGLAHDGPMYRRLVSPFVDSWEALFSDVLRPIGWPHRPLLMARFAMKALLSASSLANAHFTGDRARALFAGLAAHSVVPLDFTGSAAVGLVLAVCAHVAGWPLARGGSGAIAAGLARALTEAGGEIETGAPVRGLADLPPARAVLFDLAPRAVAEIASPRLPTGYVRRLRAYRHGPGAFKLDWALAGPIPWRAAGCRRAAIVHVGGSLEEIARAERDAWEGRVPDPPFVLLCQASLFDETRAPAGKQTAWGYCHVPNGCPADMTGRIEKQIERYAPGFRDLILARNVMPPQALERHNANLIGGDIIGGANDLRQLLARPIPGMQPYRMPAKGLYLCSASTPPGAGVHGMCGWNAATMVLRDLRRT